MEYRKLISFGKGGFVVTIPKNWVIENNLDRGSFIVIEKKRGCLILNPKKTLKAPPTDTKENQQDKEIIIELKDTNEKQLIRRICSAYIRSYKTIVLKRKDISKSLEKIKNQVKDLIGLEIIEIQDDKIVLQDFLNYNDVNIFKYFLKMDIVLRSIFTGFFKKDPSSFDELIRRDHEVNKYYFVVLKTIKIAAKDPSILKKSKITLSSLLDFWYNFMVIESIGDELKSIITLYSKHKMNKEADDAFFSLLDNLYKCYLIIMRAYHKKDEEFSFSISPKIDVVIKEIESAKNKHWDQRPFPELTVYIRNIISKCKSLLKRLHG